MIFDLGSIPDWLTAIGAVLALIFARAAARAAQRTNQQQAAQLQQLEAAEQRREEVQRQRQAENLAFWVALIGEDEYRPAIRIMNANRNPLYECTLYCISPMGAASITLNVVEPNVEPRIIQRFTERVRQLFSDGADFLALMDNNDMLVSGTFRDAANHWWYRATDGGLYRRNSRAEVQELCQLDLAQHEFASN